MSSDKLAKVLELIDQTNQKDPNKEIDADGKEWPKELLYSERMSDMLQRFMPNADDVAQIAMRGQHIARWKSPRSDFEEGRIGYLKWRTALYKFHADTTASLMEEVGYDSDTIERVKKAIGKKSIKANEDTQRLEDVTDLVFIEHYMLPFVEKHPEYDEEKWLDIVRKTWNKMSKQGQDFALGGNIALPEPLIPLIQKAVSGE
ncbi:MAG: DUF4202 domain-containing protein [bacterium]